MAEILLKLALNTNQSNNLLFYILGGCPEGHYCPQNTTDPIGCAAGTYQDLTHQSSCKTCEPGYYCLANSTTYMMTACPTGE